MTYKVEGKTFKSLNAAKHYAGRIFQKWGIVVAITQEG